MKAFLIIISSYILGSIPFALIIGKMFFNKDVREYGSHNLGGTNASRVLGLKAGIVVILLDGLKCFLSMYIANCLNSSLIPIAGLICCLGHCYPVFAQFKGGKAVASAFGYLIGITLFISKNPIVLLIAVLVFFTLLYIFRMVSLASMCSILSAGIYMLITNFKIGIYVTLLALFIIYRHRKNIERIINKTESKI